MVAPAARTALAVERICSRDSTEQGPAITTASAPPMHTSPTFTQLLPPRVSRATSLNGCAMGTTSSTPGAALSASSAERFPPEPTAATMARSAPRVTCGVNPNSLIRSITCCSSASVELLAMLMTIGFSCYCDFLFSFHPPRLADDAAKNAQNTFSLERTFVLSADALQHLALALAVINRQAA